MTALSSTDPLPISLVLHTVFCERRAWLEAAGERVPSLAIEAGTAAHAQVDSRSDDRPSRRRSVDVSHEGLGILGKCDVVSIDDDAVEIVEFKSTPLRRSSEVTPAQVVQLALQRICLEAAGWQVNGQSVYFTTTRKSIPVTIDETVLNEAQNWVATTRRIVESSVAPPPLEDDPRCTRCSHASVCLPDEVRSRRDSRRIAVRDPHGEVLHVTTPGSRVSLRRGRVLVQIRGDEVASLPIAQVHALVVHGNADVSSALMRELLWLGRMVLWCSWRGRVVGYARSAASPNGLARSRQRTMSMDQRLNLARELVAAKIANQATFLRRNSRGEVKHVISKLRGLAGRCATASGVAELFGYEGDAAAEYFRWFPTLLSAGAGSWPGISWTGRVGRGASDPLNVALNFTYGLLLGDVLRSVLAAGLDPHVGLLHSSGRNKPALALDLMEQFRPVVADSVVIGAINNGEFTERMTTQVLGGTRLRDAGRKALIAAYERRVRAEFKHPTFGYRVSWRRAMEVQARMVLGVIDGSQDQYIGVRVR